MTRETERTLRSFIERSIDGIVMLDEAGTVIEWSPGQERITGLPAARALGRPIWDVQVEFFPPETSTPEHVDAHRRMIASYLETGEAGWLEQLLEVEIVTTDGRRVFIQSLAFPIRTGEGTMTGTITRDVTERRHAERDLRSLASALCLAEERERRRIASELHDGLGQTLAAIRLELGGCRDRCGSDDARRCLDTVARGIEEAIRTTRTLTAELSPPVLYELGLEAALGWLVERERDRTGLALRYETNGEADLLDDDASVLVFQSVRELLWNIGKHSGAGAARVVVGRRGGELLVTVEDDGKGFDASREPSGNGFGLISIREKVEHMGGRLTIDSHEGRGTRVAIAMPLGPRDAGGGR